MQRKLVVLLLVASMILGVFSLAVVQAEEENGRGSGEEGRPEFVEDILGIVPDEGGLEEEEEHAGPPDFVAQLLEVIGENVNATIMDREQLQINGEALESDLPPFIMNDRFQIPVRAVATSMGAEVYWDGDERKITIIRDEEGIEIVIELRVGETTIFVNGEPQEMDVPAQIFAGHAFVPVRFVATALGEDVRWDAEARTAFIGGPDGNDAADE